ncbi:TPA_asm: DUF3310 domain-containing protein [Listeria monocytogenes]|nr:DUF3310 domain-containing protein [Listeria monocytogenes]
MFTHIRKFISKWNSNQDIYIEQMSREETIPFNKEETMTLYHVETEEDYDALMLELEEEGCVWGYTGNKPTKDGHWYIFKGDTVIDKYDIYLGVASKGYCEKVYLNIPIQKYKTRKDKIKEDVEYFSKCNEQIMESVYEFIHQDNNDIVNNPSHYTSGGIETIDYIKAKVKDYPSYAAGNILKYVSRYEYKNGIEDLKKAQFYLNDLIEWMESD